MERVATKELPKLIRVEHIVDSAFKIGVANDFTCCATWGVSKERDAFLLALWRKRLEFPDLITMLRKTYDARRAPIVIEDKASGQSALQVLRRLGLPVIAFTIKGKSSKESRADAVTAWVEGGKVYLPADPNATWVDEFIDEHAAFPSGVHDDMVDTTSMALLRMMGKTTLPDPSDYTMGWSERKKKVWNPFGGHNAAARDEAREILKKEPSAAEEMTKWLEAKQRLSGS